MRGPFDDRIEAQQRSMPPGVSADLAPARPSKVLIRLIQLLERRGYEEHASDVIRHALPGNQPRAAFEARSIQFSASPTRPPGTAPPGGAAPGTAAARPLIARDVATSYRAAAQQLLSAPPAPAQWHSLGPTVITNGQTYGASRVNVSGRVSAIALDPDDPNHLLAGAANGGVWDSADAGATWTPRTDSAATLTVGALTFDPTDPSTVYCGTGEGNWWWFLGQGILKSTDKGASWNILAGAPFLGQGFFDLAIDPTNGQQLIACTTGGLYLSTDGGTTWSSQREAATWSICFSSNGGALEAIAGCADGVFASSTFTSWNLIVLPGAPAAFDRVAVRASASDPGNVYIWAASNNVAFLWHRAGDGAAWVALNIPPDVQLNQAWYDWCLAVDPQNPSIFYCGAIDLHQGDSSGAQVGWTNLSTKPAGGDSIHPDQHVIAVDLAQPGRIYAGNDGGLFKSDDRGVHWQDCNAGLAISECEYLAHDPGSPQWVLAGTQDNGTDRTTGAPAWEHVADGDGGHCGVNAGNSSIVFHTFYGMSLERSDARGDWSTWNWVAPAVPAGEGSLFYPPFRCSRAGSDTISMGGDAVYLSRDNGASWVRLAFPAAARSSAIDIPTPDDVYVGTTDGRLFMTHWDGAAWTSLAALTTPRGNAGISDLLVDTRVPGRIWSTSQRVGGGRVFLSDDAGMTWTDRSPGLPPLPINAIEVDPQDSDRLWVGADLGVYETLDAGATWAGISTGLPNAFIGDLLFHASSRLLRAATRNRGLWEIQV
jgi:photosystem II stability/assembly factor-like uncharacterized protein